MKRIISLILSILLLVCLLAGCASRGESVAEAPAAPSTDNDNAGGKGLVPGESESEVGGGTVDYYGGHKVIRTVSFDLDTDDFDGVYDSILFKLKVARGYVEESYVQGKKPEIYGDRGRYATLSLRVPSDKVDAFITDAKTLGTLTSIQDFGQDISASYFDTESRLEVLNIQLTRLKALLVESAELADIITLETEIARVTYEIESLTSQLNKWDNLINFTTVTIKLNELTSQDLAPEASGFGERVSSGFSSSLKAVGRFFTNLLVWFLSSLPALLVIAAVTTIIIIIVKAVKKHRRKKGVAKTITAVQNESIYEKQADKADDNK